jgi:hypothetical protein
MVKMDKRDDSNKLLAATYLCSKKLPPLVSYRHQKCWRVIMAYQDDFDSIDHAFTTKMTYAKANDYFNRVVSVKNNPMGKLVLCYIVAESDGIERVLK